MSELTVLFWALFFRCICIFAAIVGAVYLAYNEKSGWGWMIFLAVILGAYSYKYEP